MDKLCRTARILDVIAKILFWICAVLGVIAIVSAVVVPFIDADVLAENMTTTMTVGGYTITSDKFHVNGLDAEGEKFVSCIILILFAAVAVFVCYGIKIVRNILKPMKNGTPFDTAVSANLKKLGFITLAGGIISAVINMISYFFIFRASYVTSNVTGENFSTFTQDFRFDATFLVIAAVLFLLSYIFRYGEELQRLSDETL